MTEKKEKILVIGPSWVGDMVLAHSLFQALKAKNPQSQIDVVAPAWTFPLLERMPEVSNAIALPFKHGELALGARWKFGKALKSAKYTQAILLVNSFKSAILPFAAGIPKRTGFLGEMRYGLLNDIRPLDKNKLKKTVERFVILGNSENGSLPAIANPKLNANLNNALSTLSRMQIAKPKGNVLGLCPGAEYGEAKRWPVAHFAALANSALALGWQVWLFGSEKDRPVTQQINGLTNNQCVDFGGNTSLGEAIDLIALCDTVVSNDSGLMHVAAALDKKVIAIYGSSDPLHTPPMHPEAVIEYLGLACSPCFQRDCPLSGDAHMACMRNISAESVLKQLAG